ncbi:hypothetical protein ACFSRY_13760 [Pontibacter locisalis]|uniref:Uncharacterized protein n=1 Tax=Pontibacter locisalis TaxID=1719035 RepID=A0ABW5IPQ4_9BACT
MEFFLRKIYPWLVEVASLSSVVPFLAAILLAFKHKSPLFRLLFVYVFIIVVMQAMGYIPVMLGTTNNLWASHFSAVLEYGTLSVIFYRSFSRPVFKKGVALFAIVFTLFSIWNAFYGDGYRQINTTAIMIENSLLIVLILLYFYKVANDMQITYLDQDPVFMLCCFLLIYKVGATMSYAMFNPALAVSYDTARMCISVLYALMLLYHLSLILVLKRTPLR